MVSCGLCGFRGSSDNTCAQPHCPICGEAYDDVRWSDRREDEDMPGSRLAKADGGVWGGKSLQKSQIGAQSMGRCNSSEGVPTSTYLNLDLQSLLHLIPEQQHNRKKRAEDVVRAAGVGPTPTRGDDSSRCDPDGVYIRPRVDPTMRVLKGRYKTQPRVAKATSMSALHRLAHPLIGYDSIQALAPKARRRRQESVERLLGQALDSGNGGGSQGRLLNKARSSVELSRPPVTVVRRRSSGSSITPMALSVNAILLQGRRKSVASAAPQQRRQHGRESRGGFSQTREVEASPLLRLRASEGRRVRPTLRRKRVATMRSVNGWVREADPTSTVRQASLDRRILALRRRKGSRKPRGKGKATRARGNSDGSVKRDSHAGDGSIFLTELETDEAAPVAETGPGQSDGGVGGQVRSLDGPWRRNSVKANPARQYPRARGGGSISGMAQRQQARRRSSGASRAPSSTETVRRRATESGPIPARRRSEVTRVKVKSGRTNSVGALDRCNQQQQQQLQQQPSRSRIRRISVGGGAEERGQEGLVRRDDPPPPPPEMSGGMNSERVVTGNAANWTPNHPGGASTLPSPRGTDHGGVTPARERQGTVELETTTTTETNAGAHEAEAITAPAWGFSGSCPTSPLREDAETRIARQRDETGESSRPCSEWQLLRRGSSRPTSRSAELLRSFEDKVGSPFPVDQHHGSTSLASDDEAMLQQQQQQERPPSLPVSDGEHDNRRRGHHRSLSGDGDDAPRPSSSTSLLALMHNRPASSGWVHRRSLPSLLSGRAESPPWKKKTSTPPSRELSSSEWPTLRKRGKRRTSLDEPSGRMQRLDNKNPTVTVGDAWGGGSAPGAAGKHRRSRGFDEPVGFAAPGRRTGAATPSDIDFERVLDGRPAMDRVDRGSTGSGSSGNLLSNAVPKPLLYVGTGGGFRLRS